jgi:hypothetical protein
MFKGNFCVTNFLLEKVVQNSNDWKSLIQNRTKMVLIGNTAV